MKTISKSTQAAASVNAAFPSFKEMVNNPKYGMEVFHKHPSVRFQISAANIYERSTTSSRKSEIVYAEVIADLVQGMVIGIRGRDFHGCYDLNHQKGKCEVYDFIGRTHILNPQEFFAILRIFWFTHMGLSFTDAQMEAYNDFLGSSSKICQIMD